MVRIFVYTTEHLILMAPRGELIAERLYCADCDELVPVDAYAYRDLVGTCARARKTPKANHQEAEEFFDSYRL